MKKILTFILCLTLILSLFPTSFAAPISKAEILATIEPMLDSENYDGIINYIAGVKNYSQTIDGGTKPYIKGNTLNFPSSLTEIGAEAFAYDSQITTAIIPESVTYIEDNAFDQIPNLTIVASEGSYAYNWAIQKGYTVSNLPDYPDEFTVTITADNFDEYFELVILPLYNAFGEIQDDNVRFGVRSKLYNMGYVLRDTNLHNVIVETIQEYEGRKPLTNDISLDFLLMCMMLDNGSHNIHFNRIVSGEITFVSSDLVTSYTLTKLAQGYDEYQAEIVFADNPDSHYYRQVVDGYLY